MSVSNLSKRRGQMLDEIMAFHRENLPKIKREIPLSDVQAFAVLTAPPVDFYAALKRPGVSLIAECKKASPSKGLMVPNYDPVFLARDYVAGGAAAISVLTDARHFQGSLEDLRDVKTALPDVPVLRKDFIFDPYQIYEARAAGADAILLIASVLGINQMRELSNLAQELGMGVLVEVHTQQELERTLSINPRIIGINNRNLQTFEVDFANTARLRALIPSDIVVVAESGLKSAEDVLAMKEIGVDAILVGETLVKSREPWLTVRTLVRAGTNYSN